MPVVCAGGVYYFYIVLFWNSTCWVYCKLIACISASTVETLQWKVCDFLWIVSRDDILPTYSCSMFFVSILIHITYAALSNELTVPLNASWFSTGFIPQKNCTNWHGVWPKHWSYVVNLYRINHGVTIALEFMNILKADIPQLCKFEFNCKCMVIA